MTHRTAISQRSPVEQRFWSRVDKQGPVPAHRPDLGPCWVYHAPRGGRGGLYGHQSLEANGKAIPTHRLAFFLAHGRWPEPCALHHCDNPPCVKAVADECGPAHIFEGTLRDNQHDMTSKGRHGMGSKTHCKRGHAFDDANTSHTRDGRRRCRACLRDWANAKYSPAERREKYLKTKK
jgi:hypothetical protein